MRHAWFRCRPRRAAFLWPRAEFWRIWLTAIALALVTGFLFGSDHAWPAERRGAPDASFFDVFGGFEAQPAPRTYRHRARHAMAVSGLASSSYAPSDVLSEARRWLGSGNVTGSHRAWCADFVNWVLTRTGHRSSGSGFAASLLAVGPRVSAPQPGDIAVMRGHATFYAGSGGRGFYGLGGNQHHRVALSQFSLRSVIAFVRPQ